MGFPRGAWGRRGTGGWGWRLLLQANSNTRLLPVPRPGSAWGSAESSRAPAHALRTPGGFSWRGRWVGSADLALETAPRCSQRLAEGSLPCSWGGQRLREGSSIACRLPLVSLCLSFPSCSRELVKKSSGEVKERARCSGKAGAELGSGRNPRLSPSALVPSIGLVKHDLDKSPSHAGCTGSMPPFRKSQKWLKRQMQPQTAQLTLLLPARALLLELFPASACSAGSWSLPSEPGWAGCTPPGAGARRKRRDVGVGGNRTGCWGQEGVGALYAAVFFLLGPQQSPIVNH